jgi:phosphate:Na+ symporter
MTLTQGIGVIMGANIGTTVTAWIIAIKISDYGLPMMGLAGLVYMFSRSDRIKYTAMSFMGLGAVFFGLELMTQGFSILKDLPEFSQWMERFTADSFVGVLKCVSIGCILTLIVQSSSATVGITMSLASIGVINFETAAALVLGENIGTTITAVLASIGMSVNARRAAAFHVLFNTIGVCWVTAIFLNFFLPMIYWMIGTNDAGQIKNITAAIALTHTMFNTTNTVVFLPFTRIAARLLTKYIPDKGVAPQKTSLTNLHTLLMESSTIAIERSRIEVIRMSNYCLEMADNVKQVMQSGNADLPLVEKAFRQEDVLDNLQDEIIEFMANMLAGNISHEVAEIARSQLRMADELESISDYFLVVLKSWLKLNEAGVLFPDQERGEMLELHDAVLAYHKMIHRAFAQRRTGMELLTTVQSQGRNITFRAKSIRDRFLKRMSGEKFDPQVVMAFNAQLNAYRRVREHSQNVAEAMVGVK